MNNHTRIDLGGFCPDELVELGWLHLYNERVTLRTSKGGTMGSDELNGDDIICQTPIQLIICFADASILLHSSNPLGFTRTELANKIGQFYVDTSNNINNQSEVELMFKSWGTHPTEGAIDHIVLVNDCPQKVYVSLNW